MHNYVKYIKIHNYHITSCISCSCSAVTMSWNDYVNKQLMAPGDMCSAGIFGLDGNPWAVSGPVASAAQPNEIVRLIKIIEGKETDKNSMRIGSQAYLYVQHDEGESSIALNRIHAPCDAEKYVITGYLSRSCFIIGVVAGNYKVGNCRTTVCSLREYLKQTGF